MLGLYALLLKWDIEIQWIIVFFGVGVVSLMWLAMVRHGLNQRENDAVGAQLGE
jgi:LPLT family lysophospholipid transporter-like MFS transporter